MKRPDVRELVLGEVGAAATKSEAGAQGGRGNKATDNVSSFTHGNGSTYTLKRLKRDEPALFQQVVQGELSANRAAIQAGFRVRTVSVPLVPDRAVATLKRHFNEGELRAIAAGILEG